jgi:Protein of unknown function (DUF402)
VWAEGETIWHREVLNSGHCWAACPVTVVRDEPGLLVTYWPEGMPFTFPPAPLVHPWTGRGGWQGNGMLALKRPDDAYSVRLFWEGPERRFACWYVNFEERYRRLPDGYETQDLELDIVVHPDGRWELKDDELLQERVREGRFTQDQADVTRADARCFVAELESAGPWWDAAWADWSP